MQIKQPVTKTDQQIQVDVLAEINRDLRFQPAEIGVEVDDGIVTLTGTVSSFAKLGIAADIAGNVAGVAGVANKLSVQLPVSMTRDDTTIARAVRDALEWDVNVPDERIQTTVRNGVVTLKGTVDYWHQRYSAEEAVTRLTGVASVNDHIVVAPSARTDQEMFEDIRGALRRRLPIQDIDVAVERGVVTLMGLVDSFRTVRDAGQIAWRALGVKDVHNKLVVRQ